MDVQNEKICYPKQSNEENYISVYLSNGDRVVHFLPLQEHF